MDTSSFNFFTPTKLIFGSGSLKNLKQIAPLYGKKCLLVSRPRDGSLKAIYKQIDTLLDSTGVSVIFFELGSFITEASPVVAFINFCLKDII